MKITPAVLLLSILNLVIYFSTLFTLFIFNYDLRDDLSIYPTYSENFNLHGIITYMFVHSTNLSHIFFNLLFLIIFGCYVEKKLGFYNFIVFYVTCSIFSFFFINQGYHLLKSDMEKKLTSAGLDCKKIYLENDVVKYESNSVLELRQDKLINNYGYVLGKSCGASCSVFGIIIFYFLGNFLNFRKFLLTILSGCLIIGNIIGFFQSDLLSSNNFYGHFGGLVFGILVYTYFCFKTKTPKT